MRGRTVGDDVKEIEARSRITFPVGPRKKLCEKALKQKNDIIWLYFLKRSPKQMYGDWAGERKQRIIRKLLHKEVYLCLYDGLTRKSPLRIEKVVLHFT